MKWLAAWCSNDMTAIFTNKWHHITLRNKWYTPWDVCYKWTHHPTQQVISRWMQSTSPSWRETPCWCVWIVSTTCFQCLQPNSIQSVYGMFWNITESLLFCSSPDNLKIVNLQGRLKSNKKLASELSFDFCIGSVGTKSPQSLCDKVVQHEILCVCSCQCKN